MAVFDWAKKLFDTVTLVQSRLDALGDRTRELSQLHRELLRQVNDHERRLVAIEATLQAYSGRPFAPPPALPGSDREP